MASSRSPVTRALQTYDTAKAGIDYSITNPALAILPAGLPFEFKNIKFYYTTAKAKYAKAFGPNIEGFLQPKDYVNNSERYENNANFFALLLTQNGVTDVRLEDYAYGANAGLVFQIAEHTGLLKYFLWKRDIKLSLVSPTDVKRMATGSGKAKKEDMHAAFVAETGVDLIKLFGMKNPESPVNDVVDAYYMLKSLLSS